MNIGTVLREQREFLRLHSKSFSLRQVALRVGIEPAYLSKIERGETAPPSEATLKKLHMSYNWILTSSWPCQGKYRRIYRKLSAHVRCSFSQLLRQLKDAPEAAVLRIVREVTDGEW
jgi:transcriptional regulator with XRE-family HTH domain